MRADNKEIRNKWIGVDEHAPSSLTLSPKQLRMVVQKHVGVSGERDGAVPTSNATARKSMFKPEVFTYYTDQTGEISPLSSDESDTEDFRPQGKNEKTKTNTEKRKKSGGKTRTRSQVMEVLFFVGGCCAIVYVHKKGEKARKN